MKLALFAYSRRGCETATRLRSCLPDAEVRAYTLEKYLLPGFSPIPKPSQALYERCFSWADAMIFVSSCGIAVRQIAPYVRDKKTDPAVICVDELGTYVIPLLSGHIGGANALAKSLAAFLEAEAVITTATDLNHRFSVDTWATEHGLLLSDMHAAKAVSAAILERDVPLHTSLPIAGTLPSGVVSGSRGDVGICIGWETEAPFAVTLRIIPRVLHLGLGCRKGTPMEAIRDAVDSVLQANQLDPRAIRCAASIDLKAQEAGLLAFCEELGIPVTFYSAEALQTVQGDFTPSDFVRSITGVDNVCERAALLGADKLIVKKTAGNGVTVAIAAERYEVHFG